MLFVPLPLFATLLLALLLVRFVLSRDMQMRAHQLFAVLVALYTLQSLLSSLRWGYGVDAAGTLAAVVAPVLPVVAYAAYTSLSDRPLHSQLWAVGVVLANWLLFVALPDAADAPIIVTYIGFGALLLQLAQKGVDHLSLSPINDTREILTTMYLTAGALIASGLTDVYLIYDFIRHDGQNAGLVLTWVQTAFALVIGASAIFGRASQQPGQTESRPATESNAADAEILERLEDLFKTEKLHRTEDLSLRRLARRLGVPDRQVSNAINRQRHVSVSQYVNEFRIQDACEMLETTDLTVLDVSLAAGFATKSNFNREFLRVTGKSPSQWRKEAKANT